MRLFANDTLVKAKRSFPFQFRYYVPASAAANSTITFKAEAEDKAGNVKTITRQVRVVPAAAIAQTPIAVGRPVLTGTPTVGSTLTITNIAFINTPTSTRYVWLRDGAVIAGATKAAYALTTDDLGHLVSARVYAGNADGEGDAETDGALRLRAAGPAGVPGPAGPAGATGATARGPGATVPGRRHRSPAGPKADKGERAHAQRPHHLRRGRPTAGRSSAPSRRRHHPTRRSRPPCGIAGTKQTRTVSGKGKVKVRLKSASKLKKAPKVVVKVGSAKSRTVTAR